MLFFIEYTLKHNTNNANLNTSHVILYPNHACIFLTSVEPFKYISCYSLSTWKLFCYFCKRNLNTSHVILYHYEEIEDRLPKEFKYISCYSLSGTAAFRKLNAE